MPGTTPPQRPTADTPLRPANPAPPPAGGWAGVGPPALAALRSGRRRRESCAAWLATSAAALAAAALPAFAHAISGDNAAYVQALDGPAVAAFGYLGAKHMVTGIDHLLFLVGVVFFLHRLRDVLVYVTLFTIGHSITLLAGVLAGWNVNAYLVDAVIGLSVAYKAFENMGGFASLKLRVDARAAVLVFGLCHGLGLATKVQELYLSDEGLAINLASFNVGVELGQCSALAAVVGLLMWWRRRPTFERSSFGLNVALLAAGFLLVEYQLAGWWFA